MLDFLKAVVRKADRDQIFFMAGSISFALLVAIVPLLLLLAGVGGLVASAYFPGDPVTALVEQMVQWLPALGEGDVRLRQFLREAITPVLEDRAGLTVVGGLLLLWLSSRIVGTLRMTMLRVFEIEEGKGIVHGKLYDLWVVSVGGILVLLNLGITGVALAIRDAGIGAFGIEGQLGIWVESGVAQLLAFLSIWVLLVGLYRYLPDESVTWRTALVAATFTAVAHELLKGGFGWYVSSVADYRTPYGNLVSLAVLFFWVHYTSISFILGGEVAWVWNERRQSASEAA
ncbi:MAG TPA: YihY/virulence factor BrkB family protein [Longimicrobiales bacterium]|nr:YihY/virulence factor BrkB family protein [Longimicrobiales bacterium]